MQPFWHYFLSLFNIPDEVLRFIASMLGALVGLAFWQPADWKAGLIQVFISYVLSHYASNALVRARNYDAEFTRLVIGFAAISLWRGGANLLKKFERNPQATVSLMDKLIDTYQKWKQLKPPGEAPDNHEQP